MGVIDTNYADNRCTVGAIARFDYAAFAPRRRSTRTGPREEGLVHAPSARLRGGAAAQPPFDDEQDRRLGDVVDVLYCGVHKLKDGYYVDHHHGELQTFGDSALDELRRTPPESDGGCREGRGGGANAG